MEYSSCRRNIAFKITYCHSSELDASSSLPEKLVIFVRREVQGHFVWVVLSELSFFIIMSDVESLPN